MRSGARVRRALASALVAGSFAVLVMATPAGAGIEVPIDELCGDGPEQGDADGLVAGQGELFEGSGVFNLDGEDQTSINGLAGGRARFFVVYENTDDAVHDVVVRADLDGESPPPGYSVKVLRSTNGKDVTNKVFGLSGLRFRDVDPNGGGTNELIVRVKVRGAPSSSLQAFVTGNYETASACGDTVRIVAGDPN